MSSFEITPTPYDSVPAPTIWKNWQLSNEPGAEISVMENRLFSDAWVGGENFLAGPFELIATRPETKRQNRFDLKPVAVLRTKLVRDDSWAFAKPDSNSSHYHGGYIQDEFAALVSLVLGVRMMAGKTERIYDSFSGSYGRPFTFDRHFEPDLQLGKDFPIFPQLIGDRNINDLSIIESLPSLAWDKATAIVKAARLYQKATWYCDADPHSAWLYLVTAVEICASCWDKNSKSDIQRLLSTYPRFQKLFEGADVKYLEETAKILSGIIGSTAKFKGFLTKYFETPPLPRPTVMAFDFATDFEAAINTIYKHRSAALHNGTQFPLPMCQPPRLWKDGNYTEKPEGLATYITNAAWTEKEYPMHLHVFAHIARDSILRWWRSA